MSPVAANVRFGRTNRRSAFATRCHFFGDRPLDFCPRFGYIFPLFSLSKGPAPEASRGMGARAVPAGGIANRSRAASGIRPSGTTDRGARCSLGWDRFGAGNARTNCARSSPWRGTKGSNAPATSQEAWPEAEPLGRLLPLARAVVEMCASRRMRGRASGTAGWTQRLSAFRFLYLFGEVSVAGRTKAGTTPSLFFRTLLRTLTVAVFAKLGRGCVARTGELAMTRHMKRGLDRIMSRVMDRDTDHTLDRGDFAVSLATLKAAPKPKPKSRPVDFAARFAIEKALQQKRYCNAFALWRTCRHKSRRRRYACDGDANTCLKQALGRVPAPGAMARAGKHSESNAAQYRRSRVQGAAMHAGGFL